MNAGKTTYLVKFIENVHKLTNIRELNQKINFVYCYNTESSMNQFREVVNKNREYFNAMHVIKKIPSISDMEHSYKEDGCQLLILLEDLQSSIRGLSPQTQDNYSSFLTRLV